MTGQSVVGTATVVYHRGGKLAVLACAHVVAFPDTLYQFHQQTNGAQTQYLRQVSIRQSQLNTLVGLPDAADLEILATDPVSVFSANPHWKMPRRESGPLSRRFINVSLQEQNIR